MNSQSTVDWLMPRQNALPSPCTDSIELVVVEKSIMSKLGEDGVFVFNCKQCVYVVRTKATWRWQHGNTREEEISSRATQDTHLKSSAGVSIGQYCSSHYRFQHAERSDDRSAVSDTEASTGNRYSSSFHHKSPAVESGAGFDDELT